MPQKINSFVPKIFTLLKKGYSFSDFHSDLVAGMTVAIVALPLSIAFAIASGATPDKGLIAAIIGGFLISFWGGSRVQIGGPTGAFVVVIADTIARYGYGGLLFATFVAGIILIVSGYIRIGYLMRYIPAPVITGFTAGIAVIIASSQIKDFLGLKLHDVPVDFVPKWLAYIQVIDTINMITLFFGFVVLMIILFVRKVTPRFPAYLLSIAFLMIIQRLFSLPLDTIETHFSNVHFSWPAIAFPCGSWMAFYEIAPAAITIAFLAGIEALLSATVADGMAGYNHRANQELVGQGIANLASSLFGGLPCTGAIARTATNIKAGARTPIAGMLHALFIFAFMFFGTQVIAAIPMVALAAVLLIVSWNMSDAENFLHSLRKTRIDRNIMILTFLLTIFVNLNVAIGVGMTLGLLLRKKYNH